MIRRYDVWWTQDGLRVGLDVNGQWVKWEGVQDRLARVEQLEAAECRTMALLDWIQAAVRGDSISEFGGSFPLLRAVVDLRARCEAAEATLKAQP